jgi:hypothetical protein
MAYGLLKDIKDYNFISVFFGLLTPLLKKNMPVIPYPPIFVDNGLPRTLFFLVLLFTIQNTASQQERNLLCLVVVFISFPAAEKRIPLAVRPGLTRFTCASTF